MSQGFETAARDRDLVVLESVLQVRMNDLLGGTPFPSGLFWPSGHGSLIMDMTPEALPWLKSSSVLFALGWGTAPTNV